MRPSPARTRTPRSAELAILLVAPANATLAIVNATGDRAGSIGIRRVSFRSRR